MTLMTPTPATLRALAELRRHLPSIAPEHFGGDNLAIHLASHFEPEIESDALDDSGTWKQGALDASDAVMDVIHAHYEPTALALLSAVETLTADLERVTSERNEARALLPHGEPGSTVYAAVERVLDEHSAWISRLDEKVTTHVALAAAFACDIAFGAEASKQFDRAQAAEAENADLRAEVEHWNALAMVEMKAAPPVLWKDRATAAEAEVARLRGVIEANSETFSIIRRNDETKFEHHQRRKSDGKRPEEVGGGSIFMTPKELAAGAVRRIDAALATQGGGKTEGYDNRPGGFDGPTGAD